MWVGSQVGVKIVIDAAAGRRQRARQRRLEQGLIDDLNGSGHEPSASMTVPG
jgi:hypothetical protein